MNHGAQPLQVTVWASAHYTVMASAGDSELWSFQSASYESRPDWVLPLKVGFERDNFQE